MVEEFAALRPSAHRDKEGGLRDDLWKLIQRTGPESPPRIN